MIEQHAATAMPEFSASQFNRQALPASDTAVSAVPVF